LNYPTGIFITNNNTYITDYGNQIIRKVSPNGIITTIAGNGTAGYNGDNIQATSAQLKLPRGIFVTSNNLVYITDTDNHYISIK
jgi:hypothetical protein